MLIILIRRVDKKFIKINNLNNVDIIVGSRFLKESKSIMIMKKKPAAIDFIYILNKICKFLLFADFSDYTSGYICIKKSY